MGVIDLDPDGLSLCSHYQSRQTSGLAKEKDSNSQITLILFFKKSDREFPPTSHCRPFLKD